MREIKFRGKRVDNGKWVYGNLFKTHAEHHTPQVCIATDEFNPIGYGSKTWFEVIPDTVEQFTGLNDKDGKEIYEGDIIQTIGNVSEVIFFDGGFKYYDENGRRPLFNSISKHSKVIGNKFQNPELLKESQCNTYNTSQ